MDLFSFQNNSRNLDPTYKMDLDLWDCLGRVRLVLRNDILISRHSKEAKTPSYSGINMVDKEGF